jgi:hypothetical protein
MDTNLYEFLRYVQVAADKALPGVVPLNRPGALFIPIGQPIKDWLDTYLRYPGTIIEFRSRPTGRMIRIPATKPPPLVFSDESLPTDIPAEITEAEMEKHFALSGSPEEVFALLHEAMMLNPLLAQLVLSAGRAYLESAPMCRACSQRHTGKPIEDCPNLKNPSWEFKERIK